METFTVMSILLQHLSTYVKNYDDGDDGGSDNDSGGGGGGG